MRERGGFAPLTVREALKDIGAAPGRSDGAHGTRGGQVRPDSGREPVRSGENHSTPDEPSTRIDLMFRQSFPLAAPAVADAPKAAVLILAATAGGARS